MKIFAQNPFVEITQVLKKKHPTANTNIKNTFSRKNKILLITLVIFSLFIGLFIALGFYTYSVAKTIQFSATQLETTVRASADQFKAQNLPGTKAEMDKITAQINTIEQQLNKLSFLKLLPFGANYFQDAQSLISVARAGEQTAQMAITAIEPYSDVLGLNGEKKEAGNVNAENRIKLILDTLEKTLPEIDSIGSKLTGMQQDLADIDPNDYPQQINGIAVRSQIIKIQELINTASLALGEFKPVIEQIPNVAGAAGERKKYLILFQNDNELRPTGGFLTAYSIIYIEDGKVTPDYSDDIYELDKKYRSRLPIPKELGRYLTTEKYWNLRDMNISPDFKTSMDQFFTEYQKIGAKDIDGIISVDTEVLTKILEIIGPISVPGYGTFSAEISPKYDCPQVVYALSEIITRPTPYLREDRKGILGPLMRELLTKVYDAPSEKNPQLFQAGVDLMLGKHIQFYFVDQAAQQAAEKINLAGRLAPPNNNKSTDYFALVNANLGGAKSNLYITYDIKQTVTNQNNGILNKSVEITYKNNHKADNCNLEAGLLCLNSTLRDWTRIYVPKGAILTDSSGFIDTPQTYEEAGFTVFDGFFTLEPDSVAKLKLSYTIPYTDADTYRLSVWKQSGITQFPLILDVNGNQTQYQIIKDTQIEDNF